MDEKIEKLNREFCEQNNKKLAQKIAVLQLGNAAPGGNNIVDGLLKYQTHRRNTVLVGYHNGFEGVVKDQLIYITEQSFAPYRNLGGVDFLGKSIEQIHDF